MHHKIPLHRTKTRFFPHSKAKNFNDQEAENQNLENCTSLEEQQIRIDENYASNDEREKPNGHETLDKDNNHVNHRKSPLVKSQSETFFKNEEFTFGQIIAHEDTENNNNHHHHNKMSSQRSSLKNKNNKLYQHKTAGFSHSNNPNINSSNSLHGKITSTKSSNIVIHENTNTNINPKAGTIQRRSYHNRNNMTTGTLSEIHSPSPTSNSSISNLSTQKHVLGVPVRNRSSINNNMDVSGHISSLRSGDKHNIQQHDLIAREKSLGGIVQGNTGNQRDYRDTKNIHASFDNILKEAEEIKPYMTLGRERGGHGGSVKGNNNSSSSSSAANNHKNYVKKSMSSNQHLETREQSIDENHPVTQTMTKSSLKDRLKKQTSLSAQIKQKLLLTPRTSLGYLSNFRTGISGRILSNNNHDQTQHTNHENFTSSNSGTHGSNHPLRHKLAQRLSSLGSIGSISGLSQLGKQKLEQRLSTASNTSYWEKMSRNSNSTPDLTALGQIYDEYFPESRNSLSKGNSAIGSRSQSRNFNNNFSSTQLNTINSGSLQRKSISSTNNKIIPTNAGLHTRPSIDNLELPESATNFETSQEDLNDFQNNLSNRIVSPEISQHNTQKTIMVSGRKIKIAEISENENERLRLKPFSLKKEMRTKSSQILTDIEGKRASGMEISRRNKSSTQSSNEPWLQSHVVNDRSIIKQNIDMETWTINSTADDDGKFQPISEDLRLLSGFGIIHNKLKLKDQASTSQILESNSFDKSPSRQNSNQNTLKTDDNNNINNSTSKSNIFRRNSERRTNSRDSTDQPRSRSWHSSNSSIDKLDGDSKNNNSTNRSIKSGNGKIPERSNSGSIRSSNKFMVQPKKKQSASDGKEHQHKRSSIRSRGNNGTGGTNTTSGNSSMIRKSSSERTSEINEKTSKEMSWSEFLADNSPSKKDNNSENNNNENSISGSKKTISRKLSILDRLINQNKNNKNQENQNSNKNSEKDTMQLASEYVLQNSEEAENNNSKNKQINHPSRASSGASSSGYVPYRPQYHSPNNNPHSGFNNFGSSANLTRENFEFEYMSCRYANPRNIEGFLLENSLTKNELWQLQIKEKYPKLLSELSDNEVKRQETIYEFIKTERSHMKNMLLINDIWKSGLKNNKNLRHIKIEKLLPGVESLLYQSRVFLSELHERQIQQYPVIVNIGDILANHWQEYEKEITKAFSKYCSNHGDALLYYKDLMANDKKFQNFINEIKAKNITQRKDLSDCLNIAMQRITKYAIMVNRIKERTLQLPSNKASEILDLEASIDCIEIIAERIDQEVKFVNKEKRLAFICRKFDSSKPTKTVGRKTSFGKADLSFDKRRLLYESRAVIKPTGLPAKPNKAKKQEPVDGILLLMTDYLVMLKSTAQSTNLLKNIADNVGPTNKEKNMYGTTSNNEGILVDESDKSLSYQFLNFQTGQPAVLPLRGLIIRENPTKNNDRFLLSAAHADIGLYELSFESATIATTFAEQTRLAAQHCPDDIFLENQEKFEKLAKNNPKLSSKLREEEEKSRQEYEIMVKKCDELMETIRRCDQRIIESINLKQQTSDRLNVLKQGRLENENDPNSSNYEPLVPTEGADKIDTSPIFKDCESILLNELNISRDHPIFQNLRKLQAIESAKDTTIINLTNDLEKQKTLSHHYNVYGRDITDLSKMERIHEIESKRFDRLRKKDRDEVKRMQMQVELERNEMEDQRRKLELQRDSLARQKSEFNQNYEDDLRKNAEQQRMLMKMREMQRYIDELESRFEVCGGPLGANSPKSYASTSPSNSFNRSNKNLNNSPNNIENGLATHSSGIYSNISHSHSTSSSKRSNSHGASDSIKSNHVPNQNSTVSNRDKNNQNSGSSYYSGSGKLSNLNSLAQQAVGNSIRRGESLSPDRNVGKQYRSKSSLSSKSGNNSQNSSQTKIAEKVTESEKSDETRNTTPFYPRSPTNHPKSKSPSISSRPSNASSTNSKPDRLRRPSEQANSSLSNQRLNERLEHESNNSNNNNNNSNINNNKSENPSSSVNSSKQSESSNVYFC